MLLTLSATLLGSNVQAELKFELLQSLGYTDGIPSTLVSDNAWNLFGITINGGPNNGGMLFKIDKGGNFHI